MTMAITIYHNARCGTSRNTLAAIREAGHEPQIVDYLVNPPTRDTLIRLIQEAGITVREAVRSKEAVFTELGLGQPGISDAALLDAMVAHPILIERPIVVCGQHAVIGRPPEKVEELLDAES